MSPSTSSLSILANQFGLPLISPACAYRALGLGGRNSVASARLAIARKTFPCPTVLVGRRRMVRLADLAAYIDSLPSTGADPVQLAAQDVTLAAIRPGPGRPRTTREKH